MGSGQCRHVETGTCGMEVVEVCKHNQCVTAQHQGKVAEWIAIQCAGDYTSSTHDGVGTQNKAMLNQLLLVAARDGRDKEVELLLTRRAFIETRRPFVMLSDGNGGAQGIILPLPHDVGMTPLMYAAQAGSVQCCEVLLKHNAHVNAREEDGLRALHFGAMGGSREVIELLVGAGADTSAFNDDAKQAIDLIEESPMLGRDRHAVRELLMPQDVARESQIATDVAKVI
mmetsp:Transcript_22165/g.40773  ORF Transcript_22165/g.40773 Transcript_22165/m.40773 type:complete len:228 (-) Transcript_22165:8-691(-)